MSQFPPEPPPPPPPTGGYPPTGTPPAGSRMQMPQGGRIARGWHLVKVSWGIVKIDKELLVLPVISFVAIMVWWAIAAGLAVSIGGTPEASTFAHAGSSGEAAASLPTAYYVFGALGLFVSSFIAIFFNAAIIGIAMRRLDGHDAHLTDGLKLAASKLPKIIGWALVTTTVGLVLRAIEERAGFIGAIVVRIIGLAWALVTYFVLPTLLFEQVGVFEGIKRSASIFKARWGEQVTGNIAITLILFLLTLPVIIVGALLLAVFWPLGVVVLVIGIGGLLVVGGALSGVFNTALYRYATTGQVAGGFSESDLAGAFKPKKRKGLLG